MDVQFIDSHAHLIDKRYKNDLQEVLDRAAKAGVKAIINVGYDLPSSEEAAKQAELYPNVYSAVGVHPHDAGKLPPDYLEKLRELSSHPKVVAIGETGLDYYRNLSEPAAQKKVFREHLQLALELSLPVIVHDRDAHKDVLDILRAESGGKLRGVMHCFSGDTVLARRFLELGFYISLAGPVTFPNRGSLADVARYVPLDRLLVETDCPYLAPHPYRGQRNEPAHVQYVARQVAGLRGISLEEVAAATTANAKALFNIAG